MIRNNILLAIRGFKKRKSFTIINILGLTLGMTVALLILTYARYELSYDRYHSRADDIYRVSLDVMNDGVFQVADAQMYPGVGLLAIEEFPEIENFAMARHVGRLLFKNGDNSFNEDRVYFANPGWLNVFDWNVIAGDKNTALEEADKVMLSESAAKKYFGNEDPVGQMINVIPNGAELPMMVTGVFKDVPKNSHLGFDILVSWQTGVKYMGWKHDVLNQNNEFLYLLSSSDLDADFEERFNQAFYKRSGYDANDEILRVYPLTDIHLKSNRTFEAEVNGSRQMVDILFIVAFAVLAIAWVNYINLATAKSLERSKEVGVRKVLGSKKKSLMAQFFTEALIINFLALVLTVTGIQMVLPLFNNAIGADLVFNPLRDLGLMMQLMALFVVGSFASGFYPSLILSNYKIMTVLSGKLRNSSQGRFLRKSLVVFQFTATMLLLVGTITVYKQVNFMRSQELGVNIDQTIVLRAPLVAENRDARIEKQRVLKTEALRSSKITHVTFSETVFGQGTGDMSTTTGLRAVSTDIGVGINFSNFRVDSDFVPAFQLGMAAGENFDLTKHSGFKQEDQEWYMMMLINETARKKFGFATNEAAIGEKISWGSGDQYTVVGVFEDYNHNSLKTAVEPMVLFLNASGAGSDYYSFKINAGDGDYKAVIDEIRELYTSVYPSSDFDYFFLDEQFDAQYRADQQFGFVFTTFSGLSIFISILGLFGLGLYEMQQRIKEIGIRKVLGATSANIIRLMSSNFMKLIAISIIIALPLAFFGANKWLDGYANRIDMTWYMFLIPAIVLLSVALITIVLQSIKTANENPVKALRYE